MKYEVFYHDGRGVRQSVDIEAYSEVGAKAWFKICHPLRTVQGVREKGEHDADVGDSKDTNRWN